MLTSRKTFAFVLTSLCLASATPALSIATGVLQSTPTAVADDGDDGGDSGGWGPTIVIGGRSGCGRLGLCLGGLSPIPGAALRPVPPAGPAPRVGPRGTWP
jgi:hypothetical protein